VDTRNGTPIRISDIGTVVIGHAVRLGRVGRTTRACRLPRRDPRRGRRAEGIVVMRRGENPLECARASRRWRTRSTPTTCPPASSW
jgi:heavy metal efflux system protein